MKMIMIGAAVAALVLAGTSEARMTNQNLPVLMTQSGASPPSPCEGGVQSCFKVDDFGNLWWCGPSSCVPWTTSQPPLEP